MLLPSMITKKLFEVFEKQSMILIVQGITFVNHLLICIFWYISWIQQPFHGGTLEAMKKKITSLEKPHKLFASNPNLKITQRRKKLIIFTRGQCLFYYIFINGGTKSNFAHPILFAHHHFKTYNDAASDGGVQKS